MTHDPKRDIRVSLREPDIVELMQEFPKLTRTEITDAVTIHGPMRVAVEAELRRLSDIKS
jgi:hypothetical protein